MDHRSPGKQRRQGICPAASVFPVCPAGSAPDFRSAACLRDHGRRFPLYLMLILTSFRLTPQENFLFWIKIWVE